MLSRAAARRNVAFFSADMILFGIAVSFLDASTVIPNFVGQATHSDILIGFSGVLFTLFWRLPQLLFAPMISRSPRKRRWMLISSTPGRMAFLVVGLLIALIGGRSAGLMLLVFFAGYAAFAIGDGITMNAWVALIGSAVPHRTRGLMFGVAQVITGISVLIVQGLLRQLLGPSGPGYPYNFAVIFAIAGALLTLSLPFIANFYERPMPTSQEALSLADYVPYLRRIVARDRPFRDFLLMRFFQNSSGIAIPFFIGYEVQTLGIPSAQAVSESLIAVTIGNVVGSVLAGLLSQRFSSRAVIYLQTLALFIGPAAALFSLSLGHEPGRVLLLISFVMIGFVGASYGPGTFNWLVAYAPEAERPVYSSIDNTLGVAALVVPLLGGVLLQATSYNVLFGLAMILAALAILAATRLGVPPSGLADALDA